MSLAGWAAAHSSSWVRVALDTPSTRWWSTPRTTSRMPSRTSGTPATLCVFSTHAHCPDSPTLSRLVLFRLMIYVLDPLIDLCQRYRVVGAFIKRHFHLVPHTGMQHMKDLIDVLDNTSRQIYAKKKIALDSNDEELKIKISEGRDLMSVMRTCAYL